MGTLYIVGKVVVNAAAGTNASSGGSGGSYITTKTSMCSNNVYSSYDDDDYLSSVPYFVRFDVGGRENYDHTTFAVGQGGPGGGGLFHLPPAGL